MCVFYIHAFLKQKSSKVSSFSLRMVDEFMVCMDRIIASAACFQESSTSSVEGQECVNVNVNDVGENGDFSNKDGIFSEGCSFSAVKTKGAVRECRICQEEDEEEDMEAPCACNGTLKFAHRKCIQKWCNKKGDITCEICNQVFSPNYSSPPPRRNPDVLAIDIRQAWGPHVDLSDPRLLALEHQFLQSEYDDYAVANSGTVKCFRSVAIILMLLFLIRQTLMLTRELGMLRESSAFFHYQVSLLQLASFLLPCYAVARSWYLLQCRRRRQG
ncbi:Protein involved in mRNA turnover and stability [Handroanthus impetiginosus]|uniref:Protein involved in mRNA turnover and stability n=1 Tax=Handroanthus impetiginosus TaxID=429701 RepID=A0A2G9GDV0_9LAMI|nr:Protein involved in mRNA turnover and stability [Handroanthus impetiginosus]